MTITTLLRPIARLMLGPLGICTLTLLAAAVEASSQIEWQPINNGLFGGELHALAFASDGEPVAAVGRFIYRGEGFDSGNPTDLRWQRAAEFRDAREIEMAEDGTLYAASHSLIVRSVDNGASWEKYAELESDDIAAIDGTQLLARLHRSTLRLEALGDGTMRVDTLPGTSEDPIYNGGNGTIWRHPSYDIGVDFIEWYDAESGAFTTVATPDFPLNRRVRDIIVLPGTVRVTIGDDGVKRSSDNGATWELVSDRTFRSLVRGRSTTLYAIEGSGPARLLHRSDDTGRTWRPCPSEATGVYRVGDDGTLLGSYANRIERLSSCEEGWVPASTGIESAYIGDIKQAADGTLWATAFTGIQPFEGWWSSQHALYRSDDGGDSWTFVRDSVNELVGVDSSGTVYVRIDSVGSDSPHPYITLDLSTDKGATWEEWLRSDETVAYLFFSSVDPEPARPVRFTAWSEDFLTLSIAGNISDRPECRALASIDGGATWDCRQLLFEDAFDTTRLQPVTSVYLDGDLRGKIYVIAAVRVGDPGFEVTVDYKGFLFDPVAGTRVEMGRPDSLGVIFTGNGSTIVGIEQTGHRVVVSTDTGRTWTERRLPEDTERWWFTDLTVADDGSIFYTGVRHEHLGPNRSRFRNDRLLVSVDRGATWQDIGNDGANELPVFGSDGTLLDTLYSAVPLPPINKEQRFGRNPFRWSTDNGLTWQLLDGEMAAVDATAFVMIDDGTAILGTSSSGLYRSVMALSDVPPVGDDPIEVPSDHLALAISPNPVDDVALIRLMLASDVEVTVELYDLLGRRVASIHDGRLVAGIFAFEADFGDLPWGPYVLYARDDRGNGELVKVWVE